MNKSNSGIRSTVPTAGQHPQMLALIESNMAFLVAGSTTPFTATNGFIGYARSRYRRLQHEKYDSGCCEGGPRHFSGISTTAGEFTDLNDPAESNNSDARNGKGPADVRGCTNPTESCGRLPGIPGPRETLSAVVLPEGVIHRPQRGGCGRRDPECHPQGFHKTLAVSTRRPVPDLGHQHCD